MVNITTALVSPPISGVIYQNPTAVDVWAHVQFSLNPTATLPASIVGEISPDNITWTTLTRYTIPAGFTAIDNAAQMTLMMVPAGYFYRLTAVQSSLLGLVGLTRT